MKDSKDRILLINYEYPPVGAGAANATHHIARSLAAKGRRPVVLTGSYGPLCGRSVEEGITVYRCNSLRRRKDKSNILEMLSYLVSAACLLPRIIKREEIGYSVIFFSFPCGPLGLLGRLWRVPFMISLRGGDVPGNEPGLRFLHLLLLPLRRLIFQQSAAIVANSKGLKGLSEEQDPFFVHMIPNGVDTDDFPKPPGNNGPSSPFVFLFAGRFQQQKNLFYLLDQIAALRDRTRKPFLFRIAGDGPQREGLLEHCRSLGLSDIVSWPGWLGKSAMKELYQSSHCFVNLSLYEGMPNTVLEAMASGLPVIASRVIGNSEVIADGVTGHLVNLDDRRQFLAVAAELVEHPERGVQLGAMGREVAARSYSWDRVAESYLHLMEGTRG